MNNIMNLLKCEFRKLVDLKRLVVIGSLTILLISLYSLLFSSEPISEWKESAGEIRVLQKDAIESLSQQSDDLEENEIVNTQIIRTIETEIDLIDYSIENDIPYRPSNVWFFMTKLEMLTLFIIITSLLLGSRVLAVEDENNTWINIIKSCNNRSSIIAAKLISAIITVVTYFLLFYIIGFIIGLIRFGINGNDFVTVGWIDGSFEMENMIVSFIKTIGLGMTKAIFYTVLISALNIVIGKNKICVFIGICLVVFNEYISAFLANYKLNSIFPFKYLAYSLDHLNTIQELVPFLLVLGSYALGFILIATYLFQKKSF
ncbi:ABC transporter permease subunit [Amphibacillus cookii]|uniref:ABC transporter permease subunit n=1 Tax=Amphibacillus cookii TaxID=767787 RepID=UPI00195C38D0|nr:ABC transporter permease subunit [Amphibacillus cookii]MBM7542256.1 ABC-2 type transport system permease protein [Amphibacillus cookii]